MKDIRNKIINDPKQFEPLAKQFSDCGSGEKYGDLGSFKRGLFMSLLKL